MPKLATLLALAFVALLLGAACGDSEEITSTPAIPPGRIAFQSFRDGNWVIFVMNADGSGQANLSNDPASDGDPAWSVVP